MENETLENQTSKEELSTEEKKVEQETQVADTKQIENKEGTPPNKKTEEEIEEKGFNYQELEKEYLEKGDLSKETREKLNKQGFSDEFINDYINGKKALYEAEINELASVVGGIESYNNILNWSSKNLDIETVQAINNIKDKTILKEFILPLLKEKMEEKEGVLPKQTLQGKGSSILADVFESQAQMFEAIRDKRYLTDKAYNAKVTAKIRASREAGIDLGI